MKIVSMLQTMVRCRCYCDRRHLLLAPMMVMVLSMMVDGVECFRVSRYPITTTNYRGLENKQQIHASPLIRIHPHKSWLVANNDNHDSRIFLAKDEIDTKASADPTITPMSTSSPLPSQQPSSSSSDFDSLDVMLNRARRRNKVPFFLGRLKATLDGKAFPSVIQPLYFMTRGDVLLLLLAYFVLNAKGFTFGLFFGKATAKPLRELLPRGPLMAYLVQLWPVVLAIGFDQFI